MTQPIENSAILALLEEATLADTGAIETDAALLDMEGWDSMGMVMFIGLVEDNFSLELSVADLRDCATAEDLTVQINKRLAERA